VGLCFIGQSDQVAPADGKLYALRDVTATVDSIPLIAVFDHVEEADHRVGRAGARCQVGAGAFMKRQVDARKLAQMMVGIDGG
jgi:pyrimidine-nucleoside phosphorylase/thymidine phosphorylase